MSDHGIETPEDDAAEQEALLDPEGVAEPPDHRDDSLEVDPADRADQERTVDLDDDEYR
jgi:hypothetical protein